jgi:hypothetical protein
MGRGGPAVSLKVSNTSREISRTLNVVALFGIAEMTVTTQSNPIRILTALVGLGFAAYNATRATVGYSDACVLHKAWRLAGQRPGRKFTRDDIIAAKHDIVAEYKAPKCASDAEIDDALANLCGLRALKLSDGNYIKEHIVFFEDGNIKS